jgi:hypothetical protein
VGVEERGSGGEDEYSRVWTVSVGQGQRESERSSASRHISIDERASAGESAADGDWEHAVSRHADHDIRTCPIVPHVPSSVATVPSLLQLLSTAAQDGARADSRSGGCCSQWVQLSKRQLRRKVLVDDALLSMLRLCRPPRVSIESGLSQLQRLDTSRGECAAARRRLTRPERVTRRERV